MEAVESFLFTPCCGATGNMSWRPAVTAYHWDGKGKDPNRDLYLCDNCAEDYYDYYDGLWQDYYGGIL